MGNSPFGEVSPAVFIPRVLMLGGAGLAGLGLVCTLLALCSDSACSYIAGGSLTVLAGECNRKTRARPIRLFLGRYRCFSLPIIDIFALLKPQFKDISPVATGCLVGLAPQTKL